jgi:WD40 repeat protein
LNQPTFEPLLAQDNFLTTHLGPLDLYMRISKHLFLALWAVVGHSSFLALKTQAADPVPVSWSKDVLPILRANCYACHQTSKTQGGFRMTDFEGLLKGGESGDAAIVAGNPEASNLLREITPVDGKAEMPKNLAPLKPTEIEIIRKWIAQGAVQDVVDTGPRFTNEKPPIYSRPPAIVSLDFSPDGSQLALNGFHEVLVLSTQDWQLKNRLIGMSPRIESVRFSPDNQWIAVAAGEPGVLGELQLWNNASKQLHRSTLLGGDTLFGLSWTHDSSMLALGMADNSIRALDLEGWHRTADRVLSLCHH